MNKTQHMSAAEYRGMMRKSGELHDAEETQMRNRCCSDRGRAFENLIVKGCQYYAQRETAVISKVYEPYRCIKKLDGGKFVGQWVGRAEPDFKGVMRGGTAIAFEAKATQKSRIKQDALTAQQSAWLDEQSKMGALAFVCVEIKGRFFMIPWPVWHGMERIYGKKYLTPDDMPELEVIYDGSVRFLEYTNGKTAGAETETPAAMVCGRCANHSGGICRLQFKQTADFEKCTIDDFTMKDRK